MSCGLLSDLALEVDTKRATSLSEERSRGLVNLPGVTGCTPIREVPIHICVLRAGSRGNIAFWSVEPVAVEAVGLVIDPLITQQGMLRDGQQVTSRYSRPI